MNPADEDHERLLIEAAQKDPSRFAELYEENFGRVWAFVIRRVRDRSIAQDVTSEVFHQALANMKKFEWRGVPFAAWLYRIAANAIADHFARTAREQKSGEAASTVVPRAKSRASVRAPQGITPSPRSCMRKGRGRSSRSWRTRSGPWWSI